MNILLVEHERENREGIAKLLNRLGHSVNKCNNGAEALKMFSAGKYAMVLADIRMPCVSGLDLLRTIMSMPEGKETDVIFFADYGDLDLAMASLRAGAADYLLKPVDPEVLSRVVERCLEQRKQHAPAAHHKCRLLAEDKDMWGHAGGKTIKCPECNVEMGVFSDCMQNIIEQAAKYHTDRQMPVLIEGETGVGKEGVAKIIHCGQAGYAAPFIDVNCAALDPTLLESELFGYEPGSFTGGLARGQKGKVELAMGGTLFLDEISEIPFEQQGKLLRLLQQKEFYRVGGVRKIRADVRLVCATNVSLEQKVKEGRFRKDLYYRLRVGYIKIPPLRQRGEEILPLARMFLAQFGRAKGKKFALIDEKAARMLLSHPWPGNIRELRNLIEWVVLMYDDRELRPKHLTMLNTGKDGLQTAGDAVFSSPELPDISLPDTGFFLEDFIDHIVCKALEMHNGNRTKTANYLGISRRVLSYRLDRIQHAKSCGMGAPKAGFNAAAVLTPPEC